MNVPWCSVATCDATFTMSNVSCISTYRLPWHTYHINYRDTQITSTAQISRHASRVAPSFAMSDVSCISRYQPHNYRDTHITSTAQISRHASRVAPSFAMCDASFAMSDVSCISRHQPHNYRDTLITATALTHTSLQLPWHTHHINYRDTHMTSTAQISRRASRIAPPCNMTCVFCNVKASLDFNHAHHYRDTHITSTTVTLTWYQLP